MVEVGGNARILNAHLRIRENRNDVRHARKINPHILIIVEKRCNGIMMTYLFTGQIGGANNGEDGALIQPRDR